jgi:uncharacterized protein (TIGR03083 family)
MVTQKQINEELTTERALLTSYLESIPEGAWDKESLCEGWRIRDVMAHVIGNAADISSGNTADAGSPEYNQRQLDERKGRSPKELLAEWVTAGQAFEDGILALDDDFWNAPYPPFGTVGQALQRLVEDAWVHRQDIRIPLGDGVDAEGPGLRATLEVTLREMVTRIPEHAPGVRSVTIQAGDFSDSVKTGDHGVDVTVSGDPATIALVATGRFTIDEATTDGRITVGGDAPAGFAKAFNIYAP